jgi:hypothetical protein
LTFERERAADGTQMSNSLHSIMINSGGTLEEDALEPCRFISILPSSQQASF